MENNVVKKGVFFNAIDIKNIIETHLNWTEVAEDQVFCEEHIMNDNALEGTSIIVGADGIECEKDSDTLMILLSGGAYKLPVKTIVANDQLSLRFDQTIPIQGTYGCLYSDHLNILTEEEKEFQSAVIEQLGYRMDKYAEAFRRDNVREVGGRGLILLEKMKDEIKMNKILSENGTKPTDLIAVFIHITGTYVDAAEKVDELKAHREEILKMQKNSNAEDTKKSLRLKRDLDVTNEAIDRNIKVCEYNMKNIQCSIDPVLNSVIERIIV